MSYNTVDQSTGDLVKIAGSALTAIYADSPIGVILPFGGTTAPTGYLICDGSAVSRTTYAALFAVIGTKFGSGDGSTTFNLPSHDFGANLYPNVEAKYIIKAIATALPSDIQEELDELQTQINAITTSLTISSVQSLTLSNTRPKSEGISNDYFKIYKYGKVVTVFFDIAMASVGLQRIATLPEGYRPPEYLTTNIPLYETNNTTQYISFDSSGAINVYAANTSSRLIFTYSFVAA